MNITFFLNSIGLGVGLAMDAFSVSLANGLNEPNMKKSKTAAIAGTFAVFQAIMPLLGWFLITTVVQYFTILEKFIPYVALILLSYIGIKMIVEGVDDKPEQVENKSLNFGALIVQGVATSIDALSAGFSMVEYTLVLSLVSVAIISTITFVICVIGVILGKKFGTVFAGKASLIGGIILIVIGLEIFIKGII